MIGIVLRLPVDLRQHRVRRVLGEVAGALHGRELGRVAEDEDRRAEAEEVAAEILVDHRAFVDHDQLRLGGGALAVDDEARPGLALPARAVDQAVDRRGLGAALLAQDEGGLAREGREQDVAVDRLGDVAGERRLAGAGIAEQAEDRPVRLFEPAGDGPHGAVLLGRPAHGWGIGRGIGGRRLGMAGCSAGRGAAGTRHGARAPTCPTCHGAATSP